MPGPRCLGQPLLSEETPDGKEYNCAAACGSGMESRKAGGKRLPANSFRAPCVNRRKGAAGVDIRSSARRPFRAAGPRTAAALLPGAAAKMTFSAHAKKRRPPIGLPGQRTCPDISAAHTSKACASETLSRSHKSFAKALFRQGIRETVLTAPHMPIIIRVVSAGIVSGRAGTGKDAPMSGRSAVFRCFSRKQIFLRSKPKFKKKGRFRSAEAVVRPCFIPLKMN